MVLNRIKSLFGYCCYKLFLLAPIDNSLVLFESQKDYSDNSRAFYEFILNNKKEYKKVWLCHDKKTLLKQKENKDSKFVYFPSFFTIHTAWYLARAKYVFFTHGLTRRVRCRKGQLIINLWHGIALKASKGGNESYYSYTLALGQGNKLSQAKFLGCNPNIVLTLGLPRNDLLMQNNTSGNNNPFAQSENCKVILWMPTFRASTDNSISEVLCDNSTGLPLLDNNEDIIKFNGFLNEVGVKVIVKIHHLQASKAIFKKQFSNIVFITDSDLEDRELQLYEIIGKSDALLTDYSSVMMDYLLVDKPMGFIINDIDLYSKSRGGFVFENIKEILAGYHIVTIDDLCSFVIEIQKGIDSTRQSRKKVEDIMIDNKDGNSCERLMAFLEM